MNGDTTDTDKDDSDLMGFEDSSSITDISELLSYLSSEGRENRKRQKIRQELVQAYIEDKYQAPSLVQSLVNKLIKSR